MVSCPGVMGAGERADINDVEEMGRWAKSRAHFKAGYEPPERDFGGFGLGSEGSFPFAKGRTYKEVGE